MKIAITGHRPNRFDNDYAMTGPWMTLIRSALQDVIDAQRPDIMITGMALGIDQMWAELAIKNKIPFIAAVPCLGQDSQWPSQSRTRYKELLSRAVIVHMCSNEGYTNRCMQKRNEWMVDSCDLLVAVYNGTPGGTHNCVEYANNVAKKPLLIVDPDQLRPGTLIPTLVP